MAFDWNSYQTAPTGYNNTTGQPNVDPSQLQTGSDFLTNPNNPFYSPGATPSSPGGITFDPSQTAPSSPLNPANGGSGGITGMPVGGPPAPEQSGDLKYNGGQTWDQNYFTTNFGMPKTPQELVALEGKITAAGGKVLRNAAGVAGKIQTPDGRIIDVINSAGAGGNGFQWLDGGGSTGSSAGGYGTVPGLGFGSFVSPFTAPTEQDALNSPGLQFALNNANRMMQNSAAAKGTLLNGRVVEAENAANIGNALQGYQGVFDRSYQTQTRNQDAPFDKFYRTASLGQTAAAAS